MHVIDLIHADLLGEEIIKHIYEMISIALKNNFAEKKIKGQV